MKKDCNSPTIGLIRGEKNLANPVSTQLHVLYVREMGFLKQCNLTFLLLKKREFLPFDNMVNAVNIEAN